MAQTKLICLQNTCCKVSEGVAVGVPIAASRWVLSKRVRCSRIWPTRGVEISSASRQSHKVQSSVPCKNTHGGASTCLVCFDQNIDDDNVHGGVADETYIAAHKFISTSTCTHPLAFEARPGLEAINDGAGNSTASMRARPACVGNNGTIMGNL